MGINANQLRPVRTEEKNMSNSSICSATAKRFCVAQQSAELGKAGAAGNPEN
ncbi:MAG: hypothetical protein ACLVJ6_09150 [Merdibacter sp.]